MKGRDEGTSGAVVVPVPRNELHSGAVVPLMQSVRINCDQYDRVEDRVYPLVSELAKVTVPMTGAVVWAITKSRLRKVKFMNVTTDSADELCCPFLRYKSQVITLSAKTAIKCSSRFRA
jgi:hypothetical protein